MAQSRRYDNTDHLGSIAADLLSGCLSVIPHRAFVQSSMTQNILASAPTGLTLWCGSVAVVYCGCHGARQRAYPRLIKAAPQEYSPPTLGVWRSGVA